MPGGNLTPTPHSFSNILNIRSGFVQNFLLDIADLIAFALHCSDVIFATLHMPLETVNLPASDCDRWPFTNLDILALLAPVFNDTSL